MWQGAWQVLSGHGPVAWASSRPGPSPCLGTCSDLVHHGAACTASQHQSLAHWTSQCWTHVQVQELQDPVSVHRQCMDTQSQGSFMSMTGKSAS